MTPPPAPFRHILAEQDYLRLNRRLSLRGAGIGLLVSLGFLALLNAMLIWLNGNSHWMAMVWPACAGLLAGGAVLWFTLRRAKAIYREQPSMAEERLVTLSDTDIFIEQASGTFRSNWSSIVKWDEWPDMLTLYVNRALFLPFPKADISADRIDYIRQRMIDSGLPKSGKLRK